jgi:hypothetical protein
LAQSSGTDIHLVTSPSNHRINRLLRETCWPSCLISYFELKDKGGSHQKEPA